MQNPVIAFLTLGPTADARSSTVAGVLGTYWQYQTTALLMALTKHYLSLAATTCPAPRTSAYRPAISQPTSWPIVEYVSGEGLTALEINQILPPLKQANRDCGGFRFAILEVAGT